MRYDVPLIPQSTKMSCWAASIAMILSWRDKASYNPETIARNPGGLDYMPSYTTGGLDPNDTYILRINGFDVLPPQCYTVGAIQSLLEHCGPLWVASWAPGPHIRVVRGLVGKVAYINDPWPVNQGARYTRPFETFFGEMEELGGRELKEVNPVYVAHLAMTVH